MSGECRIGCLPWWAGVWWLGIGSALHGAAWGALWARDGVTVVCHRLNALAGVCFAKALACAAEGMDDDTWTGVTGRDESRDVVPLDERCLCGAAGPGEWTAGNHHGAHRCACVVTKV